MEELKTIYEDIVNTLADNDIEPTSGQVLKLFSDYIDGKVIGSLYDEIEDKTAFNEFVLGLLTPSEAVEEVAEDEAETKEDALRAAIGGK